MGEVEAVQVKLTVTLVLFQPFALGTGDATATIDGKVSSTFNVTLAVAEFPALSAAVPEMTCLAPLPETTTGEGHCAIPDSESEQAKFTVTLVLFQPPAPGAGVAVAVIVGAVLSILSFTVTVTVSPALLTAVPVTLWLAPCVVTVTGGEQVFTPDTESLQVKVTVTLVLFHPAAFGGGFCVAVMVGGGGVVTVAVVVAVPVAFRPSVTERVTVNVPAVV